MPQPVDAVVAVTYRCDSRCNMCNIWQLPPGEELAPAEYRRLPATLRDVNITGGEPFLRDDIADIVRIVNERCRAPRIVISTNGFERRRIAHAAPALMKIGRNIGIAVSLDGIGEMHDEIRGVAGGFERVIETLKQLRTLRYRNVRVAFTAQRMNVDHLGAVYDLSRQFGYQFTASVAQNSELYFSTGSNESVDPGALDEELRFVIGHECGHIHNDHAVYVTALHYLTDGGFEYDLHQAVRRVVTPGEFPRVALGSLPTGLITNEPERVRLADAYLGHELEQTLVHAAKLLRAHVAPVDPGKPLAGRYPGQCAEGPQQRSIGQ